jgi:hypothetical protein
MIAILAISSIAGIVPRQVGSDYARKMMASRDHLLHGSSVSLEKQHVNAS